MTGREAIPVVCRMTLPERRAALRASDATLRLVARCALELPPAEWDALAEWAGVVDTARDGGRFPKGARDGLARLAELWQRRPWSYRDLEAETGLTRNTLREYRRRHFPASRWRFDRTDRVLGRKRIIAFQLVERSPAC